MRYRDECFAEQDKCKGKPDPLSQKTATGQEKKVKRFQPKPKDSTNPSERMRQAIDSPKGRQLYSQRFGTVEPVFANIRHNKRLTRFIYGGRAKVHTQWNLYCMVHNIEKLANLDGLLCLNDES